MNPVTEIGTLTFLPTVNIQSALAGVEAISLRQPGIRNLRWGYHEGDETRVQLIANWDDLRYHEQYIQSGADYAAVGAILTPILAAPPVVFHAHLDQDALSSVLDGSSSGSDSDPLVEMITFYSVPHNFRDVVREALDTRCQGEEGCRGFVDAPVVEEIAQMAGGVNGSAHFAAVSWKDGSGVECSKERDWTIPGIEFERYHVRF